MRYNRSVAPCPLIPVLIYPDPSVAADWLGKALGRNGTDGQCVGEKLLHYWGGKQ
jgi:hypothetical protein